MKILKQKYTLKNKQYAKIIGEASDVLSSHQSDKTYKESECKKK